MITWSVAKLNSKRGVFHEDVKFQNGSFLGFNHFNQHGQIMRRWIRLTKQRKPSLEQFLCSLLNVKTENFVGEDRNILHASKSVKVPFRGCKQNMSLLKISHKALCLHATHAPIHD